MNCYRTFDNSWKREKFGKTSKALYLIPHYGQRKLLICEIDFLNHRKESSIVYAGAAPGHHIVQLAALFPEKTFYLYDPRDFLPALRDLKNVKVFQEYFTDKIAESYNGFKALFVCDIRTGSKTQSFEREVYENLMQQKRWCELMRPAAASLKFRCPYEGIDSFDYFDGEIRLQPWCKRFSTETRLIVTDFDSKKTYVCKDYEEKLFYFNKHLRLGDYKPEGIVCKNYDYCNDCAIEQEVLAEYVASSTLYDSVQALSDKISSELMQPLNVWPHGEIKTAKDRLKKFSKYAAEIFEAYQKKEAKKKIENKETIRLTD